MYRSYPVLQGIDKLLPVDIYIAGCPPRPEALLDGLIRLQQKIAKEPVLSTLKVA
jgi:NADH-quinone oxidoreductase subunit B